LLAIPSVIIGYLTIGPLLFGDAFGGSIYVAPEHDVFAHLGEGYTGALGFVLHGLFTPTLYLSALGVLMAWFLYMKHPDLPGLIQERLSLAYRVLVRKYGFDELYLNGFAAGGRALGRVLWQVGDVRVIDGTAVNGTARTI